MAVLVTPPRLLDLKVDSQPQQVNALMRLCAMCDAPPDRPLLGDVVAGAVAALSTALPFLGGRIAPLCEVLENLRAAGASLRRVEAGGQQLLMAGRRSRYPVWAVMSQIALVAESAILRIAGAELVRALSLEQPFRPSVAQHCAAFMAKARDEESVERAAAYADRMMAEASRCTAAIADPRLRKDILFNGRAVVALLEEVAPRNMEVREAAGTIRELSEPELHHTHRHLRAAVEAGDPVAIAVALAYFMGLNFELTIDAPFEHAVEGEWVAVIDVVGGITKIDLAAALPGLAKAKPGHVPASQVLVRPLPQVLAVAQHQLAAANPRARSLRDCLPEPLPGAKSVVPGLSIQSGIAPSIARLLQSRRAAAVAAGVDRTVAAYLTAAFGLIGSAKHPYTTIRRREIWQASGVYFPALGWAEPVQDKEHNGLAVGSLVTPTVETVRAIDEGHLVRLRSANIGRRYTANSLFEFHNAFALVCAHRVSFLTAARKAESYNFTATEFPPHARYGRLVDKRVGPLLGMTAIPMPQTLHEQIRLWRAHLAALERRLSKLGVPAHHRAFERCAHIRDCKPVRLFFQMNAEDIREIGSGDWMKAVPAGVAVNGDAFRHFVPNQLRQMGVPSQFVDGLMRHQVESTSVAAATASVCQLDWLTMVAQKLDQLALDLGFHPIAGLSKGRGGRV